MIGDKKHMKVTIKDVAKECGVNVSTVSRVINNDNRISEATTIMVNEKIKEMGYTPLRKKKKSTKEIILAIPNIRIYTLGNTINYLATMFNENNYDIRLVDLENERNITTDIAQMLCNKKSAGIILYGCYVPHESANVFYQNKIPTVVRHGKTQDLISISVNNYNGIQDACSYVISRGYSKIGFIGWHPTDHNIKSRHNSFINFMKDAGLDSSIIEFGTLDINGGYNATKNIIQKHNPKAIVYSADIQAFGGIQYLRENNLSYPGDIGLIGFDDAPLSKVFGLTSMCELIEETAQLVMENLFTMINEEKFLPPREILLTPKLMVRDSLK